MLHQLRKTVRLGPLMYSTVLAQCTQNQTNCFLALSSAQPKMPRSHLFRRQFGTCTTYFCHSIIDIGYFVYMRATVPCSTVAVYSISMHSIDSFPRSLMFVIHGNLPVFLKFSYLFLFLPFPNFILPKRLKFNLLLIDTANVPFCTE